MKYVAFFAWVVVGFVYALSCISFIGTLTMPFALLATALLCCFRHTRSGGAGFISGVGFLVLWTSVVFTPGWPFALGGTFLIVTGAVVFAVQQHDWLVREG